MLQTFVVCLVLFSTVLGWDNSNVLNVHVVPHSHNDPGWWNTFEGYYQEWTKGILSSVVQILEEEPSRTFIWAEISYFQRWWEDQNKNERDVVKRLVKNGQLEFVTAGWVMNDEANTHMIDVINQLTEGHEWLYNTLDVHPKYGWAIDPFGHSPTMPYVLQQMGFEGIVINRVHRRIKQEFRDNKHLEFIWTGDNRTASSSFNMMTHMFPWKLYDIPNTCGPDWDTCVEFDFERPVAVAITDQNVKERSEVLVDMYKQKARLFRHNSVLIPLGDDFKFKTAEMTRKIMTQYEKLFKYINSDNTLGVNIRFSTLQQYFTEVQNELSEGSNHNNQVANYTNSLPSYQGDFFTYCDEGEDYWSGYFTTRPFMKGLTRSTQSILRTGEILSALARASVGDRMNKEQWADWFDSLQTARRNIALFQHHDGVTGTARRAVVADYATRLLTSLAQLAELSSDMAMLVLDKSADKEQRGFEKLAWSIEPAKNPMIAVPRIISVQRRGAVLVIFNSLAHSRAEVVSVLIDSHSVEVVDSKGENVAAQVDPVWQGLDVVSSQFTLHFVAEVPGIGMATYFILPSAEVRLTSSVLEYSHSPKVSPELVSGWHYSSELFADPISVENSRYKIVLSSHGTIKTIGRKLQMEGTTTLYSADVDQSFLSYQSRGGAYLFQPQGPAKAIAANPLVVRIVTGPIVTTVQSVTDTSIKEHILRLYDCYPDVGSPSHNIENNLPCPQMDGVELMHVVDLKERNTELITRFKTNISNSGVFFTDSNGLEMRERRYDKSLPIQGNYYPITTSAFIENHYSNKLSTACRLTVLSHQAHGASSLSEGELEVMLDRRLDQDDGRGLGEPVTDNLRTSIPLWLVLETKPGDASILPVLSNTASEVWHARNYPLHTLYAPEPTQSTVSLSESWASTHHLTVDPLVSSFYEPLQILTFAPRNDISDDIIMRIYYPAVTNGFRTDLDHLNSSIIIDLNIFKYFEVTDIRETTLSMMTQKNSKNSLTFEIKPTEIITAIIRLTNKSNTPAKLKSIDESKNDKSMDESIIPAFRSSTNNMKNKHEKPNIHKRGELVTTTKSTTGLSANTAFYLGLCLIIGVVGCFLGKKRTYHRNHNQDDITSHIPTKWKEREDSMMKLL